MPITQLDTTTALIVVDLQKGIVGSPLIDPVGPVIERSRQLCEVFRLKALPVVLVNVAGAAPGRTQQPRPQRAFPDGWTELVPELNAQPGDLLVTKHTWGAFANTDLDAKLRERGVTQVVITGVATATGVEATARQAYELGYNVTLVTDAMTDMRAEAHEYSVANVISAAGRNWIDTRGTRPACKPLMAATLSWGGRSLHL
jgi:nicotinamidase-related amidase